MAPKKAHAPTHTLISDPLHPKDASDKRLPSPSSQKDLCGKSIGEKGTQSIKRGMFLFISVVNLRPSRALFNEETYPCLAQEDDARDSRLLGALRGESLIAFPRTQGSEAKHRGTPKMENLVNDRLKPAVQFLVV